MKHVTFADKSLLMGDDAADVLLEYARLIADTSGADSVTVRAISPDGNTVDAGFLLNANSILMIESTNSEIEAPDNSEIVQEIRGRIEAITRPVTPRPADDWSNLDYDVEEVL
jgi:hypothetical protein